MSMTETVRAAMVAALKAGEKERKGTISLLLQALEKAKKDQLGKELTPEEESAVVVKMVKQIKESLDTCPADRTDLIGKYQAELAIMSEYMPKQMDEGEIRRTIEGVLTGLGLLGHATGKDKGAIMKVLMPLTKGKADGKLVNQVLSDYL